MSLDEQVRALVDQAVASAVAGLQPAREWLTPDQVAAELSLERSTVYAKIKRGVIPSHRHDGKIYVSRSELNAAIADAPSAAREVA